MLHRLALAVGLVLALAACGGSSTETSGPGGTGGNGGSGGSGGSSTGSAGGVAMTDAAVAVARAACTKIYDCCSAEELMSIAIVGGSESACQSVVAAYIALQLQAAAPAFEAGRLGYDGPALQSMIDDLSSRACDMLPALEQLELTDVLVPMVEETGACGLDYECIAGYCDGGGDARNPHGSCTLKLGDGEACTAAAQCVTGYCDGTTCTALAATPLCTGT